MRPAWSLILLLIFATHLSAGPADVVDVQFEKTGTGLYTFHVTLKHADEGWKHYADAWEVLAPDGTVLGKRVLHHPHVEEQPFTRSLSNVKVPPGVTQVILRGHDSVHGWGGRQFVVAIPE